MYVFNPALSIKDNYLKADDIQFAAWNFAGEDHQKEYQDCARNPQRTAWLRSERLQLLKEALAAEELLAFGVADGDPDAEIRLIPTSVFLASDLRMDDQELIVAALMRTFREVKVCRAIIAQPSRDGVASGSAAAVPNSKLSKLGRKDTYPLSAKVLHLLFQTEANRGLSAGRLHRDFAKTFADNYPNVPPPSPRTLQEQLKRFRQELEETSNNKTAN